MEIVLYKGRETLTMADIFVSYANEDRARAKELGEALEKQGFRVWWDRRIPLGRSFDDMIEHAIREAKIVLVLWSTASVASEWVRSEAAEGKRRQILIPAFLDVVEPPIAFRLLHGADLSRWKSDIPNPEFEQLVERVRELLSQAPDGAPHSTRMSQELVAGQTVTKARHVPSVRAKAGWALVGSVLTFAIVIVAARVAVHIRSDEATRDTVRPPADGPARAPGTPAARDDIIATYSGHHLTDEDLRREYERLPPRSREALNTLERRQQFVENLIVNKLLLEEGLAKGYGHDPDIGTKVEDLRKEGPKGAGDRDGEDFRRRLIVQRVIRDYQETPTITDEEIKDYYEGNQRLFSGTQIRCAHILVKDESLARQLSAELRRDPERFDELAKSNSIDGATAARGGDLGFFRSGRMMREFETAAFGLQNPGDLSDVIRTAFGYHIIKLVERKSGTAQPLDAVKDRIRVTLVNEQRQAKLQQHLDELKARANVTINTEKLAQMNLSTPRP